MTRAMANNSDIPGGTNGSAVVQQRPDVALVKRMEAHMAQFLPKHVGRDRFARMVLGVIRREPKLMQCPPASLMGAMLEVARLGLEPGKEIYLIPFKKKGSFANGEVQVIVDYKGKVRLAMQSSMVASVTANAVRKGDLWEYEEGIDAKLRHVPMGDGSAEITHFYAIVRTTMGGVIAKVRTRAWIDRNKKKSTDPWRQHYEAMGCKSVLHEVMKLTPQSPEVMRALDVDGAAVQGFDSETGEVFTVEPTPSELPPAQVVAIDRGSEQPTPPEQLPPPQEPPAQRKPKTPAQFAAIHGNSLGLTEAEQRRCTEHVTGKSSRRSITKELLPAVKEALDALAAQKAAQRAAAEDQSQEVPEPTEEDLAAEAELHQAGEATFDPDTD